MSEIAAVAVAVRLPDCIGSLNLTMYRVSKSGALAEGGVNDAALAAKAVKKRMESENIEMSLKRGGWYVL